MKIKKGYCHCGCGRKTNLATYPIKRYGMKIGDPFRYICGHNGRTKESIKHLSKARNKWIAKSRDRKKHLKDFWSKVVKKKGCWEWKGTVDKPGYSIIFICGKSTKAHRFSWELHNGKIPDGLTIDHLCRNRACVNPAHLEPVTHRENIIRGISPVAENAKKTHCKYGHPFDDKNTYFLRGHRQCRICQNEATKRYRKRKQAVGV